MDLAKYIDDQLTKIRKIKADYDNKAEQITKTQSSEWTTFYGKPVKLSTEQIADNITLGREAIGMLMEECESEIEKVIKETEETLAWEKKNAIQKYAAAEPVPTDEQLRRVEQLKAEYGVGSTMILATFVDDMKFHVENETVYAYSYYLIAKNSMPKDPESERTLQDLYLKMFPQLMVQRAILKNVEDHINVFRSQIILFKFSIKGESMSLIERIKYKQELASMGTINQLMQ